MGLFGKLFAGKVDDKTLQTMRQEVMRDFKKEDPYSSSFSRPYDSLSESDRKRVDNEVKLRLKEK